MIERWPITSREELFTVWRPQFLTASDVAAAFGVDPFKTPLRLYAEKAGLVGQQPDNDPMQRGRWLESAAFTGMREQHPGRRFLQPNVFIYDRDTRLGATPDGLTEDEETGGLVNLQIKCIAPRKFERWDGVPPLHYQLQVTTENMLLDAAYGLIVVLLADEHRVRLEYLRVDRHPDAEAQICKIADAFWRNVENGVMPATDYERDAETVAAMFAKPEPAPALDLSGDNRLPEILRERTDLKAAIGLGEKRVEVIDTEIKAKLGTAETAHLPGWKLSWKQQTRKEHVVRESTFRKLLVTEEQSA